MEIWDSLFFLSALFLPKFYNVCALNLYFLKIKNILITHYSGFKNGLQYIPIRDFELNYKVNNIPIGDILSHDMTPARAREAHFRSRVNSHN